MDIMKLKLTSKLIRSVASKLIERSIRKKFGYKVNIQLDDLDINAIDGNVVIKVNAEATMDSKQFNEIMKKVM